MSIPDEDPRFTEILERLGRSEFDGAAGLLAALARGTPPTPATRFASLLGFATSRDWPAVEREARSWSGIALGSVSALRALALFREEPSEEALRLALESAWLPSHPLPGMASAPLGRLWTLWEGPIASHLLTRREALAESPGGSEGSADVDSPAGSSLEEEPYEPFLEGLLALLDPLAPRAARRLAQAIEGGLDLAPARLALARLRRRSGDRDGARAILRGIPTDALEAPWSKRHTEELEACARDAELERASQVVLRRGEETLTIRRERGLFLSVEAGSSPERWMRQVGPERMGTALADLVNDHLAAGWALVDWTLDTGDGELARRFEDALERRDYRQALRLGRRLMAEQPEDATLAGKVLAAAVAVRGPAGAIELSQRSLQLGDEASSALRRHAALLWGAGSVEECLGTLWYLEDTHGPEALSPASYALLAGVHVIPRYRPTTADTLIAAGLARFPGHPSLLEMQARLRLFEGSPTAALDSLAPLLAADAPGASPLGLALQALLEEEAGSAEGFARRARNLHPEDRLLEALGLEAAGRTGQALEAHQRAAEEATGPLGVLEHLLTAMRAACRMSAFEEGLRLARRAQTLLGEPDPRCLEVIYESLTALEPSEQREDLEAMAKEARRRARESSPGPLDRARAQLAAGFHLDPVVLEPLWERWTPLAGADPLPAASPEPTTSLLPVATGTGGVALFDVGGVADRLTSGAWDWWRDPEALMAAEEAGLVVVAPLQGTGLGWLRVTTQIPKPAHRYRKGHEVTLAVPSGQVFAGPLEALLGVPDGASAPMALATELGGRFRLLPPGRYHITVWYALPGPWPEEEVTADPADIVFQLGTPGTR